MAEEDLLFGKNRHFFGGIEPSNMRAFSATSRYSVAEQKAKISISGILPADTVINGQTLCTVQGVVIRKSTEKFPENEFDGKAVADVKVNYENEDPYAFSILDTDVSLDQKYFYSAFPYTTQGVYNRNTQNRSSVTAMKYTYIFGYDLNEADENPATRVTYPADVDNAKYDPSYMDFAGKKFHYGNWPSEAGSKFMPKPCMLTYEGKVSEYLNPNDYTKTVEGRTSNVANVNFGGNAMMEWPKIYTHREKVGNVYKFRCSDIPVGDDWDCWCNYDKNNHEIDHFYTPYSVKRFFA